MRLPLVVPILTLPLLVLLAAPAMAGDGPEPPHAPTPDEAAAAYADRPATPPAAPARAAASAPNSTAPASPSTAPVPTPPAPSGDAAAAPSRQQAASDGNEAVRKAQENGSYKMKDGGMYQPPQSRPAPLWNKGYGRT